MFLVEEGAKKIAKAYRNLGYYGADVTFDKKELEQNRALVYHIREGQIAKVSAIHFKGNLHVRDRELEGSDKDT